MAGDEIKTTRLDQKRRSITCLAKIPTTKMYRTRVYPLDLYTLFQENLSKFFLTARFFFTAPPVRPVGRLHGARLELRHTRVLLISQSLSTFQIIQVCGNSLGVPHIVFVKLKKCRYVFLGPFLTVTRILPAWNQYGVSVHTCVADISGPVHFWWLLSARELCGCTQHCF